MVSLLTQRELAEFGTGGFQGQNSIALMRGSRQRYITNNLSTRVVVFDTETQEVIRRISVGYGAVDVVRANTPTGERAYVLRNKPAAPHGPTANELVKIETSTGAVMSRVRLTNFAYTLTTAPGGKSVWVGSNFDGTIWKVSISTGRIIGTVKVTNSGPVSSIAFAPGGKRAWISGLGGVSVVDVKTGKTIKFITAPKIFPGGPQLGTIDLNASGRYAFVENSDPTTSQIAAVDTKTYKVSWRVRTGSQSESFALDKVRGAAYVPNYNDDTVTYFRIPG